MYQYRPDPTSAIGASAVTLPQNSAFWLSTSAAKIVGHARLVGRNATVIAGHHDAYLADKLRAELAPLDPAKREKFLEKIAPSEAVRKLAGFPSTD